MSIYTLWNIAAAFGLGVFFSTRRMLQQSEEHRKEIQRLHDEHRRELERAHERHMKALDKAFDEMKHIQGKK